MAKYFDLTQPLWKYSPRTAREPEMETTELASLVSEGMIANVIRVLLHAGTHIDAPRHFGFKMTLDEIPLEVLCGTGVVVDVKRDTWGVITADDLENVTPKIEEGDRVILNTGWHHFYDDHQKYMLYYPGLDKSGVDWLLAKKISWLGSDTPSPEHRFNLPYIEPIRPDVFTEEVTAKIDRKRFPNRYCHLTMLGSDIPMVEQVGGEIDDVTGKRVTLMAIPPKYKLLEAAQVRVFAIV